MDSSFKGLSLRGLQGMSPAQCVWWQRGYSSLLLLFYRLYRRDRKGNNVLLFVFEASSVLPTMWERNALFPSWRIELLLNLSRSWIGFSVSVIYRVVCKGVCSEGNVNGEGWELGYISVLYFSTFFCYLEKGKPQCLTAFCGDICYKWFQADPASRSLLHLLEFCTGQLHGGKLWHLGARGH